MALNHLTPEEEPVCGAWQKFLQGALIVFLAITLLLLLHFLLPARTGKLQEQVRTLTAQVQELQQEQAMPSRVLNRYRNSICYIFGIYQVSFPRTEAASAHAHFGQRVSRRRWIDRHQSARRRALVWRS